MQQPPPPQAVDDTREARWDREEWDVGRQRAENAMADGRAAIGLSRWYESEVQLLASVPHWAGEGGLVSARRVLGDEERLALAVYTHAVREAIAARASGEWDTHRAVAAVVGAKHWYHGGYTSAAMWVWDIGRGPSERRRRWALRKVMDAFPNARRRGAEVRRLAAMMLGRGAVPATPEWRELVASL